MGPGRFWGMDAMTLQSAPGGSATSTGPIKSSVDLGAGLFLVALGLLGLAGGYNLPFGTLSGIGSGLLPRVVSLLVGTFGLMLVLQAFLAEGDRLEKWHLRGPVFVLGGVLLFAVVIRGSTLHLGGIAGIPLIASAKVPALGLIVAGPLAVIVSGFASSETRPLEVAIFGCVMTLLCGLLFKELLGLPIPFDPAGLVPDFINHAYAAVKSGLGLVFSSLKQLAR